MELSEHHTHPLIAGGGIQVGEGGRWVHRSLEEVREFWPDILFARYCETARCKHKLQRASVFNAVVYPQPRTPDCWVCCLACFELMLREVKRMRINT
jgi:hypothetical protein